MATNYQAWYFTCAHIIRRLKRGKYRTPECKNSRRRETIKTRRRCHNLRSALFVCDQYYPTVGMSVMIFATHRSARFCPASDASRRVRYFETMPYSVCAKRPAAAHRTDNGYCTHKPRTHSGLLTVPIHGTALQYGCACTADCFGRACRHTQTKMHLAAHAQGDGSLAVIRSNPRI